MAKKTHEDDRKEHEKCHGGIAGGTTEETSRIRIGGAAEEHGTGGKMMRH